MPKESNISPCESNCPKKAMLGIEARTVAGRLPSSLDSRIVYHDLFGSGIAARMATLSLDAVQHSNYKAAGCPSRASAPESWEPSSRCIADAKTIAKKLHSKEQPFTSDLTLWEAAAISFAGLSRALEPVDTPCQPEPGVPTED